MNRYAVNVRKFWNGVILLSAFILLLITSPVVSITLDELKLSQSITRSTDGAQTDVKPGSVIPDSTVLGGYRSLYVARFPGSLASVTATFNTTFPNKTAYNTHAFTHDEGSFTTGLTIITYDGDTQPDGGSAALGAAPAHRPTSPAGLGSMDFTMDASNEFIIRIIDFDLPANSYLPLKIRVFDALFADGTKYSDYDTNISTSVNYDPICISANPICQSNPFDATCPCDKPFEIKAAFASFTDPTVFTRVGAVQIFINGTTSRNDILIDVMSSNGICPTVPQLNIPIVDDCGDCNGMNQNMDDCGDCHTPLGQADPNWNSAKDCNGVCSGPAKPDDCGNCRPQGQNDTNWNADKDCNGVCGGPGKLDDCGICRPKGNNDSAWNSTKDCTGICGGTAKLDRCGVCEGDGQSCLGCNSFDQSSTLRKLDGGAKRQERAIIRFANILKTIYSKDSPQIQDVQKILVRAHEYQLRNWVLSWELPRISTVCANTSFCITTSNIGILTEYRMRNDELFKMFKQVARMLRRARAGKLSSAERKIRRDAKMFHRDNLNLSRTVPEEQFACT